MSVRGLSYWPALVLVCVTTTVAPTARAAQLDSRVDGLLTELGFSSKDLRAIESGQGSIKTLDTPVREELAYVGAIYLDAPAERFIDRFRDIVRFEKGPGVPEIGVFSKPPRPQDLEALKLPESDLADLSKCRPTNCELKLSADSMTRFEDEVDWTHANASEQANAVVRDMIFELVRDYQMEGNPALGYYDDGRGSLSVAAEFHGLLESDELPLLSLPGVVSHLQDYPHWRRQNAEDFFYWTVVDFGLKRTIRVNHVTIFTLDEDAHQGVAYAIAIKQLYASHYFHTTLELRFLVEGNGDDDAPGATLISITRSRNDGMTGFKGLFLRRIIARRSREAVRSYLGQVKRQVERVDLALP